MFKQPVRKLAAVCLSFAAGIFISEYLLPAEFMLIAGAFFATLALIVFIIKKLTCRNLFLLLLVGISAGFIWSYVYGEIAVKPAKAFYGYSGTFEAVAISYSEETSYGCKLIAEVECGDRDVKANVYVMDTEVNIEPGDKLNIKGKSADSGKIADEDTDIFTSKGIYLTVFAKSITIVGHENKLSLLPVKVNHTIGLKLSELFPEDAIGMVSAMLTGDKSTLYKDSELVSSMQRIGVYHSMAVSGMHVAFLVGFVMMLCGNRKRLGAIISIPIIIAFMTVMGNVPSVVRAGIMQIIILLAPLLGRESDSPTSISLALAVILAVNPTASKNAGLQFSFAATAGILMFAEPIRSWLLFTLFNKKAFKNKIFEKLANFISSSISVSIGGCIFTVPLSALYFGYISIIAPISNLLVLWLISLVFTGGMVCTLFGFIWTELGRIAASALTYIIRLVKNISFALSKVPFSAIYTESLYLLVWLLTAYIIFAIFLLSRKDKNKHKNVFVSVCAVAITLIAALAAAGLIAASPALTAAILDVGQGESIVLSSGSDTIIVDCGGNDFEGAGKTAANYICSQSKFRAKLLVLTHFHADHANGVKELLNLIDVKTIAVPELVDKESEYYRDEVISIAKNKNIDILYIREDTKVLFGDAVLSIYAPIGTGGENEVGLSILCSDGDYDILITGDMSGAIEKRLIMTHELPDIEVLIVGHHGSKNSTSDELLDELKPEIAVISVGYNSYGHPSNEVLERLYSRNIEVYRTDVNGNVEIKNVAA